MSQNELDNFLRQKELEFEVPFEDKYWEQAQSLLDRERGTRAVAWWNNANVRLSALAILLGGLATWYAISNQTITNETPVATTTEHVAASPYFEINNSKSNVATAGSGNHVASDVSVSANSSSTHSNISTTNPVASDVKSKRSSINSGHALAGNSGSDVASVSNNVSTSKSNSTVNHATTKTTVNSNVVNTVSGVDNKSVRNNDVNSNTNKSTLTSSHKTSNLSTQNLQDIRSDISIIHNRRAPYISYRTVNEIPVFEEMTPDDESLLKFYGLYYKSEGQTSRKIREFKRGAQYPLLSIAAVGGLNIFNQIKNAGDTNIYVGVNPYIGGKICYQWSPVMMISVQPMLVQRGGIKFTGLIFQSVETIALPIAPQYRHAYYLQLPLTVGFKISKKNTLYGGGGLSLLATTGYTKYNLETKKTEGGYKLGKGKDLNKVDYFATLGYQFRINKKISLQASFNYGFTDITINNAFDNQDQHNIQTSLGVTYQLFQDKVHFR